MFVHRHLRRTGRILTRLGRYAFDGIVPLRCAFCGDYSDAVPAGICRGCLDDLPRNSPCCPRCAAATATALRTGVCCGECQLRPPPYHVTVAPFEYAFPIDAAIKRLKFDRRLFYAPAFAHLMADALRAHAGDADALQPVPLHRWRQLRRGFNQAELLADIVGRRLSLPVCHLIDRTRATPYQSGLDRAARRRNLRGAFRLRRRPQLRHVVIVDDVITTGETCRQLAALLRRGGVETITVLALARA